MVFLLLVCCVSTFTYTLVTLRYFLKIRAVSGFLVCMAMYGIVYGVFPLWLFLRIACEDSSFASVSNVLDLSQEGVLALSYHYVYALFGFVAILLAYYGRIKKHGKIERKPENDYITIDAETYLTAWSCLIIGSVSMFLWSRAYGSIFTLIQQANQVRSGYGSVHNGLAFFKHPTKVLMLSTYLFFAIHIKIEKYRRLTIKKLFNYMGMFCSTALTFFYLMANDGRLTIILFCLGLCWLYFSSGRKIKNPIKTLLLGILLGLVAMGFLLKMDDITYFLRYGVLPVRSENTSALNSIARELVFLPLGGQVSILSAWQGRVTMTIFDDIITGIFAWFPTSLKPRGFEDVWNINTKLIYGEASAFHGQQPCGIITQGYYDMRFIGIIIACVALGIVLRKFDRTEQLRCSAIHYAIEADVLLILIRCVPYFSLYDLILGLFPVIIMILVYKTWNCVWFTIGKCG